MTDRYNTFAQAFQSGLERINTARESECADLKRVADTCLAALSITGYGRALIADSDLRRSFQLLESDLINWIGIITDIDGSLADELDWLDDEAEEAVRRFLYWGRLGQVIHHFRDGALAINTPSERAVRTSIRGKADKLAQEIEILIADPVVQAVYRQDTLKQAARTISSLRQLHAGFERTPFDIPEDTANPLQDGNTIIRRQFLLACNLLAFELFGCVRPEVLEHLLEVKSSTAEDLGLRPWPLTAADTPLSTDSRARTLRDYIHADIPLAKHKAKQLEWQTRPIIEYFASHEKSREKVVLLE